MNRKNRVHAVAGKALIERLRAIQVQKASLVCVGLDPDLQRLPRHLGGDSNPAGAVLAFSRAIVEATAPVAAAYKLNLAFFEVLGADGWRVIESTLEAIPDDALVIADGKRGDIGSSARFYANACLKRLGFDACTVSAYMGEDSVTPFLEDPDRGAFLLARTSNPGGRDFQELVCDGKPLYEHVVRTALEWNVAGRGTLGFVAGATDIEALGRIRAIAPEAPPPHPGHRGAGRRYRRRDGDRPQGNGAGPDQQQPLGPIRFRRTGLRPSGPPQRRSPPRSAPAKQR